MRASFSHDFLRVARDSASRLLVALAPSVLKETPAGKLIHRPHSAGPISHSHNIHGEQPPGAVYFAALLEFRANRSLSGSKRESEKKAMRVIRCPNKCGQVRRVTVINAESRSRHARTCVPGAATRSPLSPTCT